MDKPDITCNIEAVGPDGRPIDEGGSVTYGAEANDTRRSGRPRKPANINPARHWGTMLRRNSATG